MNILTRYISIELLKSTLATSVIVLLIVGGGRLTYYLSEAVTGDISGMAALKIVLNIVPAYLSHIIPMGTFIGLLVALGRLSSDHEMVVMEAAGMSRLAILKIVMVPVSLCALLVLFLSTLLTPYTYKNAEEIIIQEQRTSKFENITPGRFHSKNTQQVVYAEGVSKDKDKLFDVFIFHHAQDNTPVFIKAESATQYFDETYQAKYLLLSDGSRIKLANNSQAAQIMNYDNMGLLYQTAGVDAQVIANYTTPTSELFGTDNWYYKAQLYWRFSLPLMTLIIAVVGLALSNVKPRQGRFAKLVPALVLYMGYFYLLVVFRNQLETGDTSAILRMGLVHISYLLLGTYLLFGRQWIMLAKQRFRGLT